MYKKQKPYQQPWLYHRFIEGVFILLPPFICLLLIAVFPHYFKSKEVNEFNWVVLVLLIDVAHVYSTLYRTYFNKQMWQQSRTILYVIPMVAFLVSVLVYNLSSFWFWRIMAYVAVFHFIRQQYGFMRLYSRNEVQTKLAIFIDKLVIYYATIYPIIFWHLSNDRSFSWFVEGDFVLFKSNFLLDTFTVLYFLTLVIYVAKTLIEVVKTKAINLPKQLIILGTLVSWYFGIVYFNGDLTFTLLNVVSHGVPYMALVWIYEKKQHNKNPSSISTINKKVFGKYGVMLFIAIIILLAYAEEAFWDILVWGENKRIFHFFNEPLFNPSHQLLSFIVPLLALPQITHYIIDGFIWKVKKAE
ncbi:MAG: hypothetical protein ACOVMM_10790 [Chitinophagaceae bacterium]